jgi:hypothetical protein
MVKRLSGDDADRAPMHDRGSAAALEHLVRFRSNFFAERCTFRFRGAFAPGSSPNLMSGPRTGGAERRDGAGCLRGRDAE